MSPLPIKIRFLLLAAILVLAPFILPVYYISLLNLIGLYAMVALGKRQTRVPVVVGDAKYPRAVSVNW